MSERLPHVPVMLAQTLEGLATKKAGVYVDATFGFGGFSHGVLEAQADATVLAIDRDPAVRPCAERLQAIYGDRLVFLSGRFGDMAHLINEAGFEQVDGVALDLGVSSMQLDQAERGFSFMREGPLDMRMDQAGPSAADVVNAMEETPLANILYSYGEERASRRIARAIVDSRRQHGPITTTTRLAHLVRRSIRTQHKRLDPATRTFQGLRIYVNDEIGELRRGLLGAERLLAPGGRLTVIAFHSLEDREVKRFLAERSGRDGRRRDPPIFECASRKAVKASTDEIRFNRRARSARLRIGIRTSAPACIKWPDFQDTAKDGL